jgi:myo-inositol 2-dehydrogenase/D-chiro-inositol 1-dehydrogenase
VDSPEISVGIIGTGMLGSFHAASLQGKVVGVNLAAVMDLNQTRAKEIAAKCGPARLFQNPLQLIEDDAVDAVVIASPDSTHAELVLACLRVEKPVFCEKPLATTTADAQQILETEMNLGRKLVQVGFVRRYDPQHLSLKQTLDTDTIGRPILFRGWHRAVSIPTGITSEDLLVNSVIHDFDSARWLLGQDIEEVFVRGVHTAPELGRDVLDLQLCQLTLSGDCLATIELYAAARYGYEVGVEVVGERGTALIGPPQGPAIRANQTNGRPVEQTWLERFGPVYVAELQGWVDALSGASAAGPDTWDGYTSVLAAEAGQESLRSGLPQPLQTGPRPVLYDN